MIGLDLPLWTKFLIKLETGDYLTEVRKKSEISPAYINKLGAFLEFEKLIHKEKDGRVFRLILTPKGEKIKKALQKIYSELQK